MAFPAIIQGVMGVFGSIGKVSASKSKNFGKAVEKQGEAMEKGAKGGGAGGGALGGIMDILGQVFSIFKPFLDLLKPFTMLLKIFSAALRQALAPALAAMFEALLQPEVINGIFEFAQAIVDFLMPMGQMVWQFFSRLWESGIIQALMEVGMLLAEVFFDIWMAFQPIRDLLLDLVIMLVTVIADLLIQAMPYIEWFFDNIVVPFIDGLAILIEQAGPAIAWLVEVVFMGIVKFFDWMGKTLALIWRGIVNGFKVFINVIISIINFFIDIWNTLDFLNVAEARRIPALAKGGIIGRSGIAVVHKGEGVLSREVMDVVAAASDNLVGGATTNNTKNINIGIQATVLNDELTRKLAKEVSKQAFLV